MALRSDEGECTSSLPLRSGARGMGHSLCRPPLPPTCSTASKLIMGRGACTCMVALAATARGIVLGSEAAHLLHLHPHVEHDADDKQKDRAGVEEHEPLPVGVCEGWGR